MKEYKWWQRPFRMLRFDPLNDFSKFLERDMDEHARNLKEKYHCNVEWIMANGGSSPGTASIVNFTSPNFEKNLTIGERDYLREYVPIAHKYDIKVIAYVNLHWFSYEFADANAGWEQILADDTAYGRVNPLYGNGTTLCVNSPWRDYAKSLLAEVMSTGVDGIFMDGPVVFPGACYCETCRKLFKDKTGKKPPLFEDWTDGSWLLWQSFREESMQRFLSDTQEVVIKANEDGIIFLNAGGWSLKTQVARNPWMLEEYQNLTGAEVFVHPGASNEDWLDSAIMAKFLSAGRNPAVVFSHHALGGWHYVGMAEADIKREFYQTAAGGANPWAAVFMPALEHQEEKTMRAIRESWSFLEKHEELFSFDSSAANVALLRSETSALSYLSNIQDLTKGASVAVERDLIASTTEEKAIDTSAFKRKCEESSAEEFRGWCYVLTRQHIPFTVVRDKDLTERVLNNFDLIICPNAVCLADESLNELKTFCKNGGSVVSTFETGWYRQDGKIRLENTGGVGVPRPETLNIFTPATYEEYAVIEPAGSQIPEFDENELVPRPEYALKVTIPPGSSKLATYLNPIGNHYRPPQGVSDYPMMLSGNIGEGRWIYFACLPGFEWMKFKIMQTECLMAGSVKMLLGDKIQVVTDAPAPLQIELRKQRQRLNVHLVNNISDNQFPINAVIPAGKVSISVLSQKPRRMFSTGESNIPFSYENGRTAFSLDVHEQYEIVVLEL